MGFEEFDYVFRNGDEDAWYWFDEYGQKQGPYDSYESAFVAMDKHITEVLG